MIHTVWFWLLGTALPAAALIIALDASIGLPYGVELALTGVGVITFLLLSHRHAGVPR
jgi:hypothetical protein